MSVNRQQKTFYACDATSSCVFRELGNLSATAPGTTAEHFCAEIMLTQKKLSLSGLHFLDFTAGDRTFSLVAGDTGGFIVNMLDPTRGWVIVDDNSYLTSGRANEHILSLFADGRFVYGVYASDETGLTKVFRFCADSMAAFAKKIIEINAAKRACKPSYNTMSLGAGGLKAFAVELVPLKQGGDSEIVVYSTKNDNSSSSRSSSEKGEVVLQSFGLADVNGRFYDLREQCSNADSTGVQVLSDGDECRSIRLLEKWVSIFSVLCHSLRLFVK